jgi:hypothetical protein
MDSNVAVEYDAAERGEKSSADEDAIDSCQSSSPSAVSQLVQEMKELREDVDSLKHREYTTVFFYPRLV